MATNKDFIVKNGLSVGEDISVSGSVTSNLQFDNSVQAQFGTNSDLQIYSDGSNSYVKETGAGALVLQSAGPAIVLEETDGTNMILANAGGAVTLYHAGSPKLETTSTGVDITGNAVLTGELRGPASFIIDPAAVGDNTGGVVIKGDLTVEGTTTTVNSTTLDVADKNITLSVGSPNSAGSDGAGITVDNGSDTDAEIKYSGTNDAWEFNKDVGIGTNNPGSPLQVESATDYLANFKSSDTTAGVKFTDSQSQSRILTANGHLVLVADANNAVGSSSVRFNLDTTSIAAVDSGMILTNTGLGIGVASPSEALDVSGNIQATGTITGSDFSGITMGGSLSGSHDDAKVQYGNSFTGTPAQGHFFFDALNQKLKVYTGSAFVDAVPASGGGGGGSGSSDATATFRKYTYTLASSTNAVSGKEDDEVTTTNFISGRKYEITAVGNTDFTAIGASSNAIGVVFVSTGVGGGTTGKAKEVLFYATGGTQNIEVYVNGVKAVEGASNDYVATTGTSVTFTSNLASGDVVDVQVYELLTNDSYYLKSEVYTKAETNTQITTGTSAYLPLVGGALTGNITVEKSANPIISVTETGAGAVTIQGTGSGGRVYSNSGNKLLLGADGQNAHLNINTNGDVGIGDGLTSPLGMLHVRDSAQSGAQHTYIYDSTSVTVEATEPSVQLIAEDSGTHGGSYLWRYGNNTFAAIANPTDDTIDFTYGVSNANDFQVHAGTNMSSYLKVMTIGSDGNVSVAGNFTPVSTSQDIGSTANPWRNIYTQDLVLSNEKRETGNEVDGTKGNWTIQEGEEHLYIINNKSGKKYKFALEEIE